MSPNFKIGIMKNKCLLLALVAIGLLLCFSSCKKDKVVDGLIEGAVTDIDGNTYNAVQLGDHPGLPEVSLPAAQACKGDEGKCGKDSDQGNPFRPQYG